MTMNRRNLLTSTCIALTFPVAFSCRTTGSKNNLAGSGPQAEALKAFIVATLNRYLPQTVGFPKLISSFAEAMVDAKTDQAETTEYLFQTFTKDGETPALAQYFLEQFLVMSNYLAILQGKTKTLLINVTPKTK